MPSVGRGSVRTTRQGGPPPELFATIMRTVDLSLGGVYPRLYIACPRYASNIFDFVLDYLADRSPEYVAVDRMRMIAAARDSLHLDVLLDAVLYSLLASNTIPSWKALKLKQEILAKGLGRAAEMAHSEDRDRLLYASLTLAVASLLGSEKRGASRREAAALLRYASLRGIPLLYAGSRPPPPGRYMCLIYIGTVAAEPGKDGAAVYCKGRNIEAVLPGSKTFRLRR